MPAVSLSASDPTWTGALALVVSCVVMGLVHRLWTWLEGRYFPVGDVR